jgi:hypothetical protein
MASRRNYITASEVNDIVGITPSDAQLNQAEAIIDSYCGFIDKDIKVNTDGLAVGGGSNYLDLQVDQQQVFEADYFKYLEIKILGGTGAGQVRQISESTLAGRITVSVAWTTNPDATSFYRIYQYGKFPRRKDVVFYSEVTPHRYYKEIPENVKLAVAAQIQFMDTMGDGHFSSDKSEKISESIGDYSYTNAESGVGSLGLSKLIAPQAKAYLRGIRCIVGGI